MNDIDTIAEDIASDIMNGNISDARSALLGYSGGPASDAALITVQTIYALSYEMGGDLAGAIKRIKKLVNQ